MNSTNSWNKFHKINIISRQVKHNIQNHTQKQSCLLFFFGGGGGGEDYTKY